MAPPHMARVLPKDLTKEMRDTGVAGSFCKWLSAVKFVLAYLYNTWLVLGELIYYNYTLVALE